MSGISPGNDWETVGGSGKSALRNFEHAHLSALLRQRFRQFLQDVVADAFTPENLLNGFAVGSPVVRWIGIAPPALKQSIPQPQCTLGELLSLTRSAPRRSALSLDRFRLARLGSSGFICGVGVFRFGETASRRALPRPFLPHHRTDIRLIGVHAAPQILSQFASDELE